MKYKRFLVILVIFLMSVSVLGITPSSGDINLNSTNILHVGGTGPGNYSLIQSAVDNATSGDVIFIHNDSSPYEETLLIDKPLTVSGEDRNTTVINGGSFGGRIVRVNSNDVSISNLTIKNGNYEWDDIIVSISGSNATVENSNLISSRYGVELRGFTTNNSIINNYFTDMRVECGVISYGDHNLTIENNVMNLSGDDAWTGISIFSGGGCSANNNIIRNNVIIGPNTGIFLGKNHGNLVENNTVKDTGFGMYLGYSSRNVIAGNEFKNIGRGSGFAYWEGNSGISSFYSSNNTIINNHIVMKGIKYGYGVNLMYSSNSTVQGNTVENAARGLGVFHTEFGNDVVYNTIQSSEEYGILLHNTYGNEIHHNNLIDNSRHAFDDTGGNRWNVSSGGNYWSDFGVYSLYPEGKDEKPFSSPVEMIHPTTSMPDYIPVMTPKGSPYFIDSSVTWSDTSKDVSYLSVSGDLTIINSTVNFRGFSDGIEVQSGGRLTILNSTVKGIGYGNGYNFKLYSGSVFRLENSTVKGAGWRPGAGEWGGINVLTKDAVIRNNTIKRSGGGVGINLYNESGPVPLQESSVYVENNFIKDCYEGIKTGGSEFDPSHINGNRYENLVDRFLFDEWNSDLNAVDVGLYSASIEWSTYLVSDSKVLYGESDSYGKEMYESDITNSHSVQLSNLEPNTTYHFKVVSKDRWNYTLYSSDHTFKTGEVELSVEEVGSSVLVQERGDPVNITCRVMNNTPLESVEIYLTDPEGIEHVYTMVNVDGTDEYYFNSSYEVTGDFDYYVRVENTDGRVVTSDVHSFSVYVITYHLDVSVSPSKYGYASLSPDGAEYEKGTEVDVVALALEGYRFDHWDGDVYSEETSISLVLDKNYTLVAHFEMIPEPVNSIPVVNITYPSEVDVVSSEVVVEGEVWDEDGEVEFLEIRVDDGDWEEGNVSEGMNWSFMWDTTEYENGYHEVYARCYDGKNYSETDFLGIEVFNNNLPTVSIEEPDHMETVNGTVSLRGTVEDEDENHTVDYVELKISEGDWFEVECDGEWSYKWNTTGLENSVYNISVRAFDGQDYSDAYSITVDVDNTVEEQQNSDSSMMNIVIAAVVLFIIIVMVIFVAKEYWKR